MNEVLQEYVLKFLKLRQGVSKYGPAPHKPVLLLAVLRGFDEGWIQKNQIDLSPELVGSFKSIWHDLVTTGHSPLIAQPFFYLRSEQFWHLIPNPGFEEWVRVTRNCKAIGVLHQAVAYVQLDPELYSLMLNPLHREILKQTLLQHYFADVKYEYAQNMTYVRSLENQIMQEPSEAYASRIRQLQETLDKQSFEEEVFVRSGLFKRQIPLVYHNTCCISELRVETSVSASLLDACHIVPFSTSHDDTISNGLSLCPTLHRAFDRGLIAVDPDQYTVMVSNRFSELSESVYSIKQFEGRQIQRPADERFWPNGENLAQHLERFAENF